MKKKTKVNISLREQLRRLNTGETIEHNAWFITSVPGGWLWFNDNYNVMSFVPNDEIEHTIHIGNERYGTLEISGHIKADMS